MAESRDEILDFLDNFSSLWTEHILAETREKEVMDIIREILHLSDKGAGEALLAFYSAIRYITGDKNALQKLEKERGLRDFAVLHRDGIINLSVRNKVQANLPERAFPVLELVSSLSPAKPVCVVELGASLGNIGRTLLHAKEIIEEHHLYLRKEQQLPSAICPVSRYIGYELQIPDRKWFLSCIHDPLNVERLGLLLDNYPAPDNFSLSEKNALDFRDHLSKEKLGDYTVIVLTSFFLYQFDEEKRGALISAIRRYTEETQGHWINQTVVIAEKNEYYVEVDGKRKIKISDDLCTTWESI